MQQCSSQTIYLPLLLLPCSHRCAAAAAALRKQGMQPNEPRWTSELEKKLKWLGLNRVDNNTVTNDAKNV